MIAASDENTSFLIPSSLGSYLVSLEDESSDALVVRAQKDIGEKNNIGVLLTRRSASDYKNQVAAFDGKYYFTSKDVFSYQLMHSSSDNPDSIRFDDEQELLSSSQSDHAVSLSYRHNEENYSLRAAYNDFGKDFRADMGFIGKVDYKKLVVGGDYTWYGKEDSKWTRWGFFGDWDRTEDQSGLKLEEEFELHFNLRGPLQFNTNLGVVERDRYFDGSYFDEQFFMMWFEFKPASSLTVGNFMQIGDQIDFAHSQAGEIELFEPYIRWQFGQHLSVNINHTNQVLDVSGGELFTARLTDLRLAYQFNNRSRLSLSLLETNIHRNTLLYSANQDDDLSNDVEQRTKRFGTQIIYSYKINPQSLIYLGYSDNALEDSRVDSLEKFDKTVFAKFSYLWQS